MQVCLSAHKFLRSVGESICCRDYFVWRLLHRCVIFALQHLYSREGEGAPGRGGSASCFNAQRYSHVHVCTRTRLFSLRLICTCIYVCACLLFPCRAATQRKRGSVRISPEEASPHLQPDLEHMCLAFRGTWGCVGSGEVIIPVPIT